MSAWLERRPYGYLVVWRNAEGSRSSKSYPSKAEAAQALRDFRTKTPPRRRRRVGGPAPVDALTLTALGALWMDAKRADGVSGASTGLRRALAVATALGWERPGDASAVSVRAHLAETEGKGRRDLSYLRAMLRWGSDHLSQPVDRSADAAMRPGASGHADVDLFTDAEWKAVRARAYDLGQGLLIDCLATYGWRPITACRITCGDVHANGTVSLAVKRRKSPWTHPLFPLHAAAMRALAAGRKAGERLFLSSVGTPWPIHDGRASRFSCWYGVQLKPLAPRCGGAYALKRWAISHMEAGRPPWSDRLTIAQIQLFTGHKVASQVLTYLRTNHQQAMRAMGASCPPTAHLFEIQSV